MAPDGVRAPSPAAVTMDVPTPRGHFPAGPTGRGKARRGRAGGQRGRGEDVRRSRPFLGPEPSTLRLSLGADGTRRRRSGSLVSAPRGPPQQGRGRAAGRREFHPALSSPVQGPGAVRGTGIGSLRLGRAASRPGRGRPHPTPHPRPGPRGGGSWSLARRRTVHCPVSPPGGHLAPILSHLQEGWGWPGAPCGDAAPAPPGCGVAVLSSPPPHSLCPAPWPSGSVPFFASLVLGQALNRAWTRGAARGAASEHGLRRPSVRCGV